MNEKTVLSVNGLVIREISLNDKDKLLTVLTDSLGKKTILARGVKTITSKRASGLSLFCYSTFELEKRGDKEQFKDATPINCFFNIHESLQGLALASYIAEAIGECTAENNDESELLRLALNCLYAIDKQLKPYEFIKAVFELKAACVLGFMPDTTSCAISGRSLKDSSSKKFAFNLSDGCFIADDCFSKAGSMLDGCELVSKETLDAIRFVSYADQKKMLSFALDDAGVVSFGNVCEKYFISKTEKRFRSLSYYYKIIAQ